MKRILFLLTMLLAMVLVLAACGGDPVTSTEGGDDTEGTTETTIADVTTEPPALELVNDSKPVFQVIAAQELVDNESDMLQALCNAFVTEGVRKPMLQSDRSPAKSYEIIVGKTSRKVEYAELTGLEWSVSVQGNNILLQSASTYGYQQAIDYFLKNYVTGKGTAITVPGNLNHKDAIDLTYSSMHDMTYEAIKNDVWESYNDAFWERIWVNGNWFWDTAEILETYIDAYEQTGDPEIGKMVTNFAQQFIRMHRKDWSWNEYNDDIMWSTIAFCRITLLTGDKQYYDIAKANYDKTWARAYDDTLGGGLYWRIENNTKNSCVNCPGAIAACLIGEISGDESYYEKAKSLMDWELQNMFEKNTGRVYDAYKTNGEKSTWASTYNQGTFIGACTYLYKHYQDQTWLDYAQKAAEYAMENLDDGDSGVLNGEANVGNNDLPGFKGILTRWLYRYAKETDNVDILLFLQHNADVAYSNRNDAGLIWTAWNRKTPASDEATVANGYNKFGMSTAVALLFNCQPWWDTATDATE